MNPPFNAATAVSLGIGGRDDFAVAVPRDFDDDDSGPASFNAGGRFVFPVA